MVVFGNFLIMRGLHPDGCDTDPSHRHNLAAHQCSWEGAELLGLWWVLAPEEKPGCSTCLRCDSERAVAEERWQFPISDGRVNNFLEQGWGELTQEPGQGPWRAVGVCYPLLCHSFYPSHLIPGFNSHRVVAGLGWGVTHSKT